MSSRCHGDEGALANYSNDPRAPAIVRVPLNNGATRRGGNDGDDMASTMIGVRRGVAVEYAYVAWLGHQHSVEHALDILNEWATTEDAARCIVGLGELSEVTNQRLTCNRSGERHGRIEGDATEYVRFALREAAPDLCALFDGEAGGWTVWPTRFVTLRDVLGAMILDISDGADTARRLHAAFESTRARPQARAGTLRRSIKREAAELAERYRRHAPAEQGIEELLPSVHRGHSPVDRGGRTGTGDRGNRIQAAPGRSGS